MKTEHIVLLAALAAGVYMLSAARKQATSGGDSIGISASIPTSWLS